MKIAVVELGSNSCKVLLADSKQNSNPLLENRIPCRIATHVDDSGALSPEGEKLILDVLAQAREMIQPAVQTLLIGTEALRRVTGIKTLTKIIKINTGLDLKVLSAEEEAKSSFMGVTAGQTLMGKIVLLDTGGLSTELVFAQGNRFKRSKSFKLGAVALAAKYLRKMPMANSCYYGLEEHVSRILRFKPPHNPILIGTGGAVTTCASVAQAASGHNPQQLEGYQISRSEIFRQLSLYRSMSLDQIKSVPGMDGSRADTIIAGTMIILKTMDILGVSGIKVSSKGVRHGCLITLK